MRFSNQGQFDMEKAEHVHTAQLRDFVDTDQQTFFFLRDPFDIEISMYWELRNKVYMNDDPTYVNTHKLAFGPYAHRWVIDHFTPNDFIDKCREEDRLPSDNVPEGRNRSYRYTGMLGTLDEYVRNEHAVATVLPFWDFERGVAHLEKRTGKPIELDYRFRRNRHRYVKDVSDSLSPENIRFLTRKLEEDTALYQYIRHSPKLLG